MDGFIGKRVEEVISQLEKSKEKFQVVNNNHNVNGDVTLVTNVQKYNDCLIITTGEFIFDVKGNGDAKKIR